MFISKSLLDQMRTRFFLTVGDAKFLGKQCEYYIADKDINGVPIGVGGIEGWIVAVRQGGPEQLFVDIAVTTNMPDWYVVKENISAWYKGPSYAFPDWPLLYEFNTRTYIQRVMDEALNSQRQQLSTASNQVRHLKLVPKAEE